MNSKKWTIFGLTIFCIAALIYTYGQFSTYNEGLRAQEVET